MNEDLSLLEKEIEDCKKTELLEQHQILKPITEGTDFSKAVDRAKLEVIKDASVKDEKFVNEFTEQLKQATLKSAQVEQEKQQLEKQNVQYAQELLETKQKLNEATQQINDWDKKQKRRQFHYDGVKPIMEFVGIKTPMNLVMLYFLTFVLVWFFLLSKLFKGTIGAIIAGAEDADRPKAVKGFLWTLIGLTFVLFLSLSAIVAYALLKRYGIIN